MKPKLLLATAILFLVPGMAFARPKESANVEFDQPVTVAGTQLAPGHYKLIWDGAGPVVTVKFAEGKKTVATVTAKLLSDPNQQEAIVTDSTADKTSVLQAIDLKNMTIQFENAAPRAGN